MKSVLQWEILISFLSVGRGPADLTSLCREAFQKIHQSILPISFFAGPTGEIMTLANVRSCGLLPNSISAALSPFRSFDESGKRLRWADGLIREQIYLPEYC